jgi:hypothetical protein
MAGFLSNLFGGKKANDAQAKPKPEPKAKPEAKAKPEPKPKAPKVEPARAARVDNSNAYFLDTDNARTMGNADYMRTASTTRRTFPKTLTGQQAAFEQTLSSIEIRKGQIGISAQPKQSSTTDSSTQGFSSAQPAKAETERRRPDRSMDAFRAMAKEIRK